jgi:hypothetical protein
VQNSSSSIGTGPPVVEEDAFKIFVDYLEVDPVRVQVSFSASSMVSRVLSHLVASGPGGERFRALKLLLDVVSSALSKVDNAPLRFTPLVLRHAFSADLITHAVAHYASQALRQAYVVLGTLDVLGNPAKILANISAGLRDFIYEPAKGLGQGNIWQFSIGLYRGSVSLTSRLILSSLDGIQSFASSLHAGIMPLVGLIEDDHSTLSTRHPPPRLPTSSFSTGDGSSEIVPRHRTQSEGSIHGLVQGFSALILEPIRGARVGGVHGLRAGVARGIISVVLRPVRGLLEDVVGICRVGRFYLQPHLAHAEGVSRIRSPRLFTTHDAALTLYSAEMSIAQNVLRKLCAGIYWKEGLVFCSFSFGKERCTLLTTRHVLAVRVFGPPTADVYLLEWALPVAILVQAETIPPSSVLLHFLPSSLDGRWLKQASQQQQQQAVALLPPLEVTKKTSSGRRSSSSSDNSTGSGSSNITALFPSYGPAGGGGKGKISSSNSRDSAGLLPTFGAWLQHSLAPSQQRARSDLRMGEHLLELPDREAVQGFVKALRSLEGRHHRSLTIRVLPYFEEGGEQEQYRSLLG